jgi:lysozyme family protein
MTPSDKVFNSLIEETLAHEGGYSNNSSDAGGETKYGISKRSYPDVDIKNLTLEQAKAIYKKDFWDNQGYSQIEDINLASKVFDLGVNMGTQTAVILLQRALKANGFKTLEDDGIYGSATVEALKNSDTKKILIALRSEAAGYYRRLVTANQSQKVFLKGWLNRAYA